MRSVDRMLPMILKIRRRHIGLPDVDGCHVAGE